MAEEEPLAQLVLEILRRRRRATLQQIMQEIFREVTRSDMERIRRILTALETAGAVARYSEPVRGPIVRYWYYDARPLRRIILRRPGGTITEREISSLLGIPMTEIPRLTRMAVQRGWLKLTPQAGVYQVPAKIFRVQKMKAWRTDKKPEMYQVSLSRTMQVPRQLVLDGYAPSEETPELEKSVHGAVRIVVYTATPERWTEERLARIMRGLFAQEGITLEIFSNLPYIHSTQAYEAREVDIDEKPPELELDEVDVWLWVAKEEGYTYMYHYRRRPWGWEYERYEVK